MRSIHCNIWVEEQWGTMWITHFLITLTWLFQTHAGGELLIVNAVCLSYPFAYEVNTVFPINISRSKITKSRQKYSHSSYAASYVCA